MKPLLLAAMLTITATVASAQSLPTRAERRAADIISYGTVGTAVALDIKAAWDSPNDRTHQLQLAGVRLGLTYGWAAIFKTIVQRQRPCATLPEGCWIDADNTSFYSMHT